MPTLIYNSTFDDSVRGAIDFDTDSFKAMLVTSAYTPNKDTHTKRSDITSEVSGAGYTAGGVAVTCSVTKNTASDRIEITFTGLSWNPVTLTGVRQVVIYKARGGAASADELVCVGDLGADLAPNNGPLTITVSTPMYINNPA